MDIGLLPRRTTNDAAAFVENRIILPQEQAVSTYAAELDKFVSQDEAIRQQQISQDLWQKANEDLIRLLELVGKAQVKLNKKEKGKYLQLNPQNCQWIDVMSEVKTTAQGFKMSTNAPSKAQGCIEKLGQYSETFEAWLGLLPSGDYGSGICGAFKLLVGAAGRFVKVEDSIYTALSEIPETIQNARTYIDIYRDHPDALLTQKTFDLYRAILQALIHIMQFFVDSSFHKFVLPIVQQDSYKSKLTKSLENVRKLSDRIKEEATQCLAARVAKLDRNGQQILTNTNDSKELLQKIYTLLASNPGFNFRRTVAENQILLASQDQLLISDDARSDRAPSSPRMNFHVANRILTLLDFDKTIIEGDLAEIIGLGPHLEDQSQVRAAFMVQSDEFRIWLSEDESRSLLVNGCADLEGAESPSPLSLVVAEMTKAIPSNKAVFIVQYFCGYHTKSDDSSNTIMASLLGQLLTQIMAKSVAFDLSFLDESDMHVIKNHDLRKMYKLFEKLTEQLPRNSVLIIALDEIHFYEILSKKKHTQKLVQRLVHLVEKQKDAICKLLITCHGQTLGIQQYFDTKDIIYIPEDLEANDATIWEMFQIREAVDNI